MAMQEWGLRCEGDRKWVLDMVLKPSDLCSTSYGSFKYMTITSNKSFRHKNLVSLSLFSLYKTTKLRIILFLPINFIREGTKSQWDNQETTEGIIKPLVVCNVDFWPCIHSVVVNLVVTLPVRAHAPPTFAAIITTASRK